MTQKDSKWTLVFGKKTLNGVSQEGMLAQKPTLCVCFFLGGPNYTTYPLILLTSICLTTAFRIRSGRGIIRLQNLGRDAAGRQNLDGSSV